MTRCCTLFLIQPLYRIRQLQKYFPFFFFFLSFFFVAALECAVVQMWQVFQMEFNCMWIQNSSTLVDHVLIIWFSKCALGYACSECVYLPSFTAICTASFTFFFCQDDSVCIWPTLVIIRFFQCPVIDSFLRCYVRSLESFTCVI